MEGASNVPQDDDIGFLNSCDVFSNDGLDQGAKPPKKAEGMLELLCALLPRDSDDEKGGQRGIRMICRWGRCAGCMGLPLG